MRWRATIPSASSRCSSRRRRCTATPGRWPAACRRWRRRSSTTGAATPSAIWTQGDPDGAEILKRLKALPGFGDQKARIFLALLGKQMGLEASGWREAAGSYGEDGSHRSVADIVDPESLARVRATKQAAKAAAKAAK